MKLPAQAEKLKETLRAAGFTWNIQGPENEGEFTYRYDDGSERIFTEVPVFQIQGWFGDVAVVAGWIKNPVTERWMLAKGKAIVLRTMRDNEFRNEVEMRVNQTLGTDYFYWTYESVKHLIALIEKTETADEFEVEVNTWK